MKREMWGAVPKSGRNKQLSHSKVGEAFIGPLSMRLAEIIERGSTL